ncbi:glycosyltransferase family 32 protein [Curvularia clavata]|uniref:Glycosyltransferase family 32 protein n=1 Tax=Curvularia clavata TaxID=95742 RepID=A0A9Q8Z6K0_CURCL|nr:glycosyltransferase family 32 protein [Curvularia clavata]
MLPRPPQLAKVFNYYTLIALCTIGLVYHFVFIQGKFIAPTSATAEAPGASEALHHNRNGIPRLIWYKLGPKGISNEVRNWTDTCIKGNPEYQAHFITDESGDDYVRKTFAFRPDIVQTYLAFSIPIYKADMLRYLLLWDQGGIWYDLDVSCEGVPIDEWVPVEHQDVSLVVGWEFDAGWPEPFRRQFASWTIMSKPRSSHMMQVVDDILDEVRQKTAKYQVPVEGLTLEMMGDVVDFTGPRRLTTSVFKSLEKEQYTINTTEVHSIMQPVSIGDVLIMPGRSFAATANKYTPEQEALLPPQLVTHHYAGSWKNDKGGETKRRR